MFRMLLVLMSFLLLKMDAVRCQESPAVIGVRPADALQKLTRRRHTDDTATHTDIEKLGEKLVEGIEKMGQTLGQTMTEAAEKLAAILAAKEAVCKPSELPDPEEEASVTASSSVYVRWGSHSCPAVARKVYSGVVGGGDHTQSGAAVNALCLTTKPVYDEHAQPSAVAYLYGAEYETQPESTHDLDVVCAVCRTPYATTLMIPGTKTCHAGWTRQYSGYLMTGHPSHAASSEYSCVDAGMEASHSSHRNDNGHLFYYVVGSCGSLPCPPYQEGTIVTCVVCSK